MAMSDEDKVLVDRAKNVLASIEETDARIAKAERAGMNVRDQRRQNSLLKARAQQIINVFSE